MRKKVDTGSIELVVLGLLAALIVVLAIPLIGGMGGDGAPNEAIQADVNHSSQ